MDFVLLDLLPFVFAALTVIPILLALSGEKCSARHFSFPAAASLALMCFGGSERLSVLLFFALSGASLLCRLVAGICSHTGSRSDRHKNNNTVNNYAGASGTEV